MSSKTRIKDETSLLLYNAHLFGDNPSWGNALTNFVTGRPQKHFDDERLSNLIGTLRRAGTGRRPVDIIGLCEIWDNRHASLISENLRSVYRQSYRPRIKPGTNRDQIVLGPGLMLLTRLRIIKKSWTPFRNSRSLDSLSQKGFLCAVLETAGKRRVNLILTHLQSGMDEEDRDTRLLQLRQLREFISDRPTSRDNIPTIIMGDLNIIAENEDGSATDEYERSIEILNAVDIFRTLHPSARRVPGYTSDARTNHLLDIFHGETFRRKRLDFYLVIDSTNGTRWTACEVEKLPMKSSRSKRRGSIDGWPKYISDHYALAAKFAFDNESR